MKRILVVCAAALLIGLGGCGTTNNFGTTVNTPVSKIKDRVFVTNQFASLGTNTGQIVILDGQKDVIGSAGLSATALGGVISQPATIGVGGLPTIMVLTPDKKNTLVFDQSSNNIQILDNASEQVAAQLGIGDNTSSVVLLSDNSTGFAALRNSGQVAVFNYQNQTISTNIAVPTVRTLVLSHNGAKLLAFSDDSNSVNVIDTAAKTTTVINSSTFDRPVNGVFSSDDSKAYILSCGRECGGTTARVSVLDITSGNVTGSVAVSAATVGLLDSAGNLYVAGTQGTAGKLDVLAVSGMTVSKSGVSISDGYHTAMVLASNNRLFIGARTCNNVTSGCLTMYNTSAGTAVIEGPKGDVTGMQPITGRNIVYVAEGGELRIYDTTKDAEVNSISNGAPIDIVGKAWDVKAIDQ